MPPQNEKCFIATYDEFYGRGSTLESALTDLRSSGPSGIDIKDVDFYESKRLTVELKIMISNNDVD